MITKQTPGVYIEELPVPVTITGTPTCPAFLGRTEFGEENKPTLVTGWGDFIAKFGRPVWHNCLAFTISQFFKQSVGACYVVKVAESADSQGVAAATVFALTAGEDGPSATMTFRAASRGTWGNGLWIALDVSAPLLNISVFVMEHDVEVGVSSSSSSSIYDEEKTPAFGDIDKALIRNFININSIKTQQMDLSEYGFGKAENVYVLENFMAVSGDENSINNRINLVSSFIRIDVEFTGNPFPLAPASGCYPIGNVNGLTPSSSSSADKTTSTPGVDGTLNYKQALNLLEKIEGVNLISLPDLAMALVTDEAGSSSSSSSSGDPKEEHALTVMNDVLGRCPFPNNWFYVADAPATKTIGTTDNYKDIVDFKNAKNGGDPLTSPYGAMYWPWIVTLHPVTGNGFFPTTPSGAIIARYVSTDQTIGVHQPAAGVSYGALPYVAFLDVDTPITDDDQSVIYPEGINVIRNRINYGISIWGARTLSHDPAWRYVNVRRLFNLIETSLVTGLQWAVFQDINRLLWESVKREVTQFLVGIWKSGGLFGDTQSQAFRVTCDETNNSAETIEQGYLYVRVEIAPVRPGEFIVIEIAQKMADPSGT